MVTHYIVLEWVKFLAAVGALLIFVGYVIRKVRQ